MRTLGLCLRLVQMQLQSIMEYRAAFFSMLVAVGTNYAASVLLLWIMVDHFGGIGEWSPFEVTFFWGINTFAYAAAGALCLYSFYGLGNMIRTGEFDNVLTKPVNPLLFIALRQFNFGYITQITVATSVIILSVSKLGIPVTLSNLAVLGVIILSGAMIYGAVFIATAVPAFWTVRNEALASMILWELGTFIRYPLSVYQRPIQLLFTVILPYGFVSFYPAQLFFEKREFVGFHPGLQYLSPAVGVVCLLLAYQFWRFGLSRYQSTGS